MSESRLDAAEAARLALTEAEAFSRSTRRMVAANDLLERSLASFAVGFLADRAPDGHDLLSRYGAAAEAHAAATSALRGLEDALESLRFAFTDEAEPNARLRARAIDELREYVARRRSGKGAGDGC